MVPVPVSVSVSFTSMNRMMRNQSKIFESAVGIKDHLVLLVYAGGSRAVVGRELISI